VVPGLALVLSKFIESVPYIQIFLCRCFVGCKPHIKLFFPINKRLLDFADSMFRVNENLQSYLILFSFCFSF
jgi:hypothetical protein